MGQYRLGLLKTVSGNGRLRSLHIAWGCWNGGEEKQYTFLGVCAECLWRRPKKILTAFIYDEGNRVARVKVRKDLSIYISLDLKTFYFIRTTNN